MNACETKPIDKMFYVHKKFGCIDMKDECKKNKIEKQDNAEPNPPKRVKVEALKYKGNYKVLVNTHNKAAYTKPTNMTPRLPHPILKLNSFQPIIIPNAVQHIIAHTSKLPPLEPDAQQPHVNADALRFRDPMVLAQFSHARLPNNSAILKQKIMFPLLTNTKQTPASACKATLLTKPNNQKCVEPDSTTAVKKMTNKTKENKYATLTMPQRIVKTTITPTFPYTIRTISHNFLPKQRHDANFNPQCKFFNTQSTFKPPMVLLPRPSPLLFRKLVERQLDNKAQNGAVNTKMDTDT